MLNSIKYIPCFVSFPWNHQFDCFKRQADQIDASNLVRVYGALLWNVGKVPRFVFWALEV